MVSSCTPCVASFTSSRLGHLVAEIRRRRGIRAERLSRKQQHERTGNQQSGTARGPMNKGTGKPRQGTPPSEASRLPSTKATIRTHWPQPGGFNGVPRNSTPAEFWAFHPMQSMGQGIMGALACSAERILCPYSHPSGNVPRSWKPSLTSCPMPCSSTTKS